MIHKATAMVVRQNLGELLNGVQYHHDTVLITKAGKPVAALVDIDLFEKIRHMKSEFERMSTDLARTYKGIDIAIAEKEIKEAIKSKKKGENI